VNKRTKDGKKKDAGGSSQSGGSSGGGGAATDKDVYVLTDANFEQTVYGSKDIWLVEFYAPWCGHCKALEPEWNASASQLKGKVKFGKVDATE
jgi:protein disulfide-isomerase A6